MTYSVNSVVKEAVGEDVVPLISFLKGNGGLSEFELAKKIGKEVNATRTLLYKLYDANLVNFKKKREKKTGWYIYYWEFNPNMIGHLFKNLRVQRLIKLNLELTHEKETQFFSCQGVCTRLDFEAATNLEFRCPECGDIANIEDNSRKIIKIEQEIKSLSST